MSNSKREKLEISRRCSGEMPLMSPGVGVGGGREARMMMKARRKQTWNDCAAEFKTLWGKSVKEAIHRAPEGIRSPLTPRHPGVHHRRLRREIPFSEDVKALSM